MNSDEKPIKIKVENVSKVFGKQTKKAIQMLSSGKKQKRDPESDRINRWCQSSKL